MVTRHGRNRFHFTARSLVVFAAMLCLVSRTVAAPPAEPLPEPADRIIDRTVDRTGAPPGHVRVAGIVLKWLRTDKEANYQRAEAMIERAARGGAQIVCTTECFLDGYAIKDKTIRLDEYRALGESIPDGPFYQRLAKLADRLDLWLVAGMLEADGEERYNTAALINAEGKLVGRYRKHKLEHELVRNTPGNRTPTFDTPYGRIGIMICADRRDGDLVKRLCESRPSLLICPSGGMFGTQSNDPIVQARSKENGVPIVFVHPAEFLVTGPEGDIQSRKILGDQLEIADREVGSGADQNEVLFFDVPLSRTANAAARSRSDESR